MNAREASVSQPDKSTFIGARKLPSLTAAASRRGERRYLPTLIDRLCDDAPSEVVESADVYSGSRADMRRIVQRDLALLLNTTDHSDLLDAERFPKASASTINYGVPALAGGYLSEKKWADIENMIRKAIRTFEPRLMPQTLVVRPLIKEHTAAHYNVLIFEISGHVLMQPYPLEFIVQSSIDLESNRIELHPTRTHSP